jgi:hypothetical protein
MLFSNVSNVLPRDIYIDGIKINQVDCTNIFGLHIDHKLSWKPHVDSLCKAISRNVGIINILKFYLPEYILITLYNTLVLQYLTLIMVF